MAKINLLDGYASTGYQGLMLPAWPRDMPRQTTWNSTNGQGIDAAGEYLEYIGQIAGPRFTGTKTIESILWRSGLSSASNLVMRVSIQDRDTTVVPVRGDGVDDQYAELVNPAQNTNFNTIFASGTARVVSWGDGVVVRWAISAISTVQFNMPGMNGIANPGYHEHFATFNTGTPASSHFIGCRKATGTW